MSDFLNFERVNIPEERSDSIVDILFELDVDAPYLDISIHGAETQIKTYGDVSNFANYLFDILAEIGIEKYSMFNTSRSPDHIQNYVITIDSEPIIEIGCLPSGLIYAQNLSDTFTTSHRTFLSAMAWYNNGRTTLYDDMLESDAFEVTITEGFPFGNLFYRIDRSKFSSERLHGIGLYIEVTDATQKIFFKQEREIWHINQDPITMLKTKRLTGFKEPFKAKFTLFPQGYRGLAESYELEMPVEFIPF